MVSLKSVSSLFSVHQQGPYHGSFWLHGLIQCGHPPADFLICRAWKSLHRVPIVMKRGWSRNQQQGSLRSKLSDHIGTCAARPFDGQGSLTFRRVQPVQSLSFRAYHNPSHPDFLRRINLIPCVIFNQFVFQYLLCPFDSRIPFLSSFVETRA